MQPGLGTTGLHNLWNSSARPLKLFCTTSETLLHDLWNSSAQLWNSSARPLKLFWNSIPSLFSPGSSEIWKPFLNLIPRKLFLLFPLKVILPSLAFILFPTYSLPEKINLLSFKETVLNLRLHLFWVLNTLHLNAKEKFLPRYNTEKSNLTCLLKRIIIHRSNQVTNLKVNHQLLLTESQQIHWFSPLNPLSKPSFPQPTDTILGLISSSLTSLMGLFLSSLWI